MNEQGSERSKVWMPLFLSLALAAGMILGFNLRDSLRNKRDLSGLVRGNDRLDEIIALIKNKYADTVNTGAMYTDAVAGILHSLDPHTVYIPADELQGVNDDLEGGFSGIGVEFSVIRDTVEVTNVIDNGPAMRVGVAVGDQLIKVEDSLVAGTGITSERIIHLLKGKQNSVVRVAILGEDGKRKTVAITRDMVPVYSIDASIMLDSVTAFIKINRFSATTYDEFMTALKELKRKGAKQLVLDLRDNPGGYLEAATMIADNFLDGDKLILFTKGLHTPKTEYKAAGKGIFEQGRLAVLIDESSASASEILAGAVQDWDRGVIIGRRSFGKGLVQQQYDLAGGAALRLTVARYYTPSGRCIQRSFAKGKDAYEEDYESRFTSGELTGKDSLELQDTIPYYTGRHRLVYGGGGIKPDVYVPYDTLHLSSGLISVIYSKELKIAVWDYFIRHHREYKSKSVADFSHSFNDRSIRAAYLASLSTDARARFIRLLSRPGGDEYFAMQVQARVARLLFRDNGYYSVSATKDEVVNRALSVLRSDEYLNIVSGK